MLHHTDVLIAGDGIAGLALSFLLEKKGIEHLVLSRKTRKKPFPLGETLPPSALPLLQSLGLLEIFEANATQKTYGYDALWGGQALTEQNFFYHSPFQYGLKIDKSALVKRLENGAGSRIMKLKSVGSIVAFEEGISAKFETENQTGEIRAKIIVDATGRNRFVLNQLGIPVEECDSLLAYSCHLPRKKHPALVHGVFVESFAEGWGIVSELNERLNVVSLFCPANSALQNAIKHYENWPEILSRTLYLKHFLSEANIYKVVGAKANSSRPVSFAGDQWLTVGDAAMAFDPLSSHGISNAVFTAQKASEAIAERLFHGGESAFAQYDQMLDAIFQAYLQSRSRLYRQERRWAEPDWWERAP